MALPIKSILWAPSNAAHYNHLHVEGDPRFTGTPPALNPGMSPAIQVIYAALTKEFGKPSYMTGGDWTHMGWYNRRRIAGTSVWSQHAWSNALDIGPYYGVAQQKKFYDFLTNTGDDMALTADEEKFVKDMFKAVVTERNSNGSFAGYSVDHLRNHPVSVGGLTEAQVKAIINDSQIVAP